eukprot:gene806-447_t
MGAVTSFFLRQDENPNRTPTHTMRNRMDSSCHRGSTIIYNEGGAHHSHLPLVIALVISLFSVLFIPSSHWPRERGQLRPVRSRYSWLWHLAPRGDTHKESLPKHISAI